MRRPAPSQLVYSLVLMLVFVGCTDTSSPTGPGSDPSDPEDGSPTAFNSDAAPGSSAEAFLADDQYTELKLEIDYMAGYEPTASALDSLQSALKRHLDKTTISIRPPDEIPAKDEAPYSADAIRSLEDTHRDHYTEGQGETIWAYFLIVDGKFTTENVVGIAYYNTSMAFFGKTIEEISGGLTQPSQKQVEATVFRHEFGHNLGLVNNGIPMQEGHHDKANGAHCTNDQCVMYHAIETTDYFANVFDGSIPSFEQFCSADMEAQN